MAESTGALVSLHGLTVDFDTGKRIVRALHGIDLEVRQGEVVCLLGNNAAGKTTLVNVVLGLVPITAGSVLSGTGGSTAGRRTGSSARGSRWSRRTARSSPS